MTDEHGEGVWRDENELSMFRIESG